MPRQWIQDSAFFGGMSGTTRSIAHYLEIDCPDGHTRIVSDTEFQPANLVRSWGEIAPTISPDEGSPDAQSFDVEIANRKCELYDGAPVAERLSEALNVAGIEGSRCRLYALDVGRLPDQQAPQSTSMLVFAGFLRHVVAVNQHFVRIRIDGRNAYEGRPLSHLVRDDYPQAPTGYAGLLQPIVYGRVEDFPLIPVDVGVVGSLGQALAAGNNELVLAEDVARWPASGTIQIGAFELATYSGKDEEARTLNGLARARHGTLALDHAADTVVMQRPDGGYKFLMADPTCVTVAADTVRIGGRLLRPRTNDFYEGEYSNDGGNIVLVNPARTARGGGRKFSNMYMDGIEGRMIRGSTAASHVVGDVGEPIALGGITASRSSSTDASSMSQMPISNAAHMLMIPWRAPRHSHVWPHASLTYPPPDATLDDDHPGFVKNSTVLLYPNTPKTYSSYYYSDQYMPSRRSLRRDSFAVYVDVEPACYGIQSISFATQGRWVPRQQNVKELRCRVGGVSRTYTFGMDDAFGAASYVGGGSLDNALSATLPAPYFFAQSQFIEFDFGADVDPYAAPHDVTIEAICSGGYDGSKPACRIRNVVQAVKGEMVASLAQNTSSAAISQRSHGATDVDLDFSGSFSGVCILNISLEAACDYVKIDMGGKIVRVGGSTLTDGPGDARIPMKSRVTAMQTISVLVENPSTHMTIAARNFGRDQDVDQGPLDGSGSNLLHPWSIGVIDSPNRGKSAIAVMSATLTRYYAGETTSSNLRLIPAIKAESTYLIEHGEYPTATVTRYNNIQGYATMSWPWEVTRSYLENVMGVSRDDMDTDSLGFYSEPTIVQSLNGAIMEQIDQRLGLVRLLRASPAWLEWDATIGKYIFKPRKTVADALAAGEVRELTPADWVDVAPTLERSDKTEAITKVNVRYRRDWMRGRDADAYTSVATSGSGKQTADDRYVMDFIRDKTSAQALADFYAGWDGVPTRRVGLRLLPKHFDLCKGDIVTLSMPIGGTEPAEYLQGINGSKWIVLGVGYAPGSYSSGSPTLVPIILQEVPV